MESTMKNVNRRPRVTPLQVIEIRDCLDKGIKVSRIPDYYDGNITKRTVRNIKNGKCYSNIQVLENGDIIDTRKNKVVSNVKYSPDLRPWYL